MQSKNFNFSFLTQNQSQKEVMLNENFRHLDILLNSFIQSMGLSSPPEEIKTGQIYIVASPAKDEWEGKDNQLTYYYEGWRFIQPQNGMFFFVLDEKGFYRYLSGKWERCL